MINKGRLESLSFLFNTIDLKLFISIGIFLYFWEFNQ